MVSAGVYVFTYYKDTGVIKDVLYHGDNGLGCVTDSTTKCDDTNKHQTDETALRYRAFYPIGTDSLPDGHDYNAKPLPLMAFFHAGGFKECTQYDDDFSETMGMEFARKGFIFLSVEYRTGRLSDIYVGSHWTAQQQLATCKGIQDVRGALQSIVKRNANSSHGGRFKIDTSQFFIGGASAGAVIAVNSVYLKNQNRINQIFLTASSSPLTIKDAVGPIDTNYYFGNSTYMPVVRGILSCWGAILMPKEYDNKEDSFFISNDAKDNAPIIAFHGFLDPEISYSDDTLQSYHNSKSSPYNQENFCLCKTGNFIIKSPGNDSSKVFVKKGSGFNMYNILMSSSINRFTQLYTDCNGLHGLDGDDNVATTDYGTNYANDTRVTKYIAQRAAVFFQVIMNYTGLSIHPPAGYTGGRSYFTDCKNNRKCIDDSDNNTCGSSGISCPTQ